VISGVGEGSIPDRWHSKCKVAEVSKEGREKVAGDKVRDVHPSTP
jgi:hypothetical protein